MQAPYPLITAPQLASDAWSDKRNIFAWDMSMIHNVMIRGVNTVWTNAPLVTPKDELAFADYALIVCELIFAHHHGEETIIFPFLSKKLTMEQNMEQHEQFQGGLKDLQTYFEGVSKGTLKYDGRKARELITAFGDKLVQHFHDEIPTLAPEELNKFDKKEFDAMMDQLEAHIKEVSDMFRVFPFTLLNHDSETMPNWPLGLPPPLKWFVKNVAPWRHSGYWKFAAYDSAGRAQVYSPA